MTSDSTISELELVVLACATAPVTQQELHDRVLTVWVSPAPLPSSTAWFAALMAVREVGYVDTLGPGTFLTTPRGHRLLQRALCGALGAPRPGALTFPQAMALADLLPARTLVTVLRTRLDALDREQHALARALAAAHDRGDDTLRIAALNLREGLLNAERAFLFTFVGDVLQGFLSLEEPTGPTPTPEESAAARA
jgi:hypothetical protein